MYRVKRSKPSEEFICTWRLCLFFWFINRKCVCTKNFEELRNNVICEAVSLKSLTFENGIENIGGISAFNNCDLLEELTIPSSVKTIAGTVFSGCDKLKKVYIGGDAPEVFEYPFGLPEDGVVIYYDPVTKGWDKTKLNDYNLLPLK